MSNDAAGDTALAQTIVRLKEKGITVIVIAHRPSAIASVDKLAMIKDGALTAFGPKDEVLKQVLKSSPSKSVKTSKNLSLMPSPKQELVSGDRS